MATSLTAAQPTDDAPGRLTRAELQEWDDLDEERRRLSREAEAIKRQQGEIEKRFRAYLEAKTKGQKVRRVETCGFELSIETRPKAPAWKTLFRKLCGADQVAKAEAEAGTTERFVIRRAS